MIQLNLLPDVKQEYLKAERTKRLVVVSAVSVTAAALGILILLAAVVFVFQKKYMNDLTKDITTYSNDLKNTTDLDKILTVQNQLNAVNTLHEKKQDTARLMPFIRQITPVQASVSNATIDFDTTTITLTGAADSLVTVNKFVDTLKFTNYKLDGGETKAFSDVVLSSFGRADKGASYTLTLSFDPTIFDNTKQVELVVPARITTRSETEKPTALFEAVTGTETEE